MIATAEHILASALRCIRRRFGVGVTFVAECGDGGNDDCPRSGAGGLHLAGRTVVPIRLSDGRLYGRLHCHSNDVATALSDAGIEAVQLLADYVSLLLETEMRAHQESESILERIRGVLENRSFHAVYQPIVRLDDDCIVGYEALTRFTGQPLQPPDAWFEEAARVGLQATLETHATAVALAGLSALPPDTCLSINVSPTTLLSREFLDALEPYPPARLMLEVTEHDAVESYAELSSVLEPLRTRGLRLAVDDAGAGFASFRHILMLRPDVIKLDASLVQRVDSDSGSRAMAAALVNFAAATGSAVVAECVETRAQLRVLRELQVSYVQGYLLGKPERAERLLLRLAAV